MSDVIASIDRTQFAQLDHFATPVFVLETDADGVPRYVAFNAHARAVAGRPLSDYLGRTAQDVYPGGLGRNAYSRHCDVVQTGRPMTYELELPLAGQNRTIRTTLIPEAIDGGTRCRLYGSSVDITLERNQREAQITFETMTTEMEQFVALAAHDLRAPMRNMAQLADMMREDFVDHGDGKIDLLNMMEEVATKSMALISDVLAHAHAVDTFESETTFNFADLCRDICDVLDPRNLHLFSYTTASIHTDRTALQIGLRNIIDNALKHGGREQLRIDITLQRGTDGMLDVVLADNGMGFPDSAMNFIQGGAFKVDSGYGLLGVRRMVQARGGTMTAQNAAETGGAVIRFSLPGTWIAATNTFGDPLLKHDVADTPPRRRAGGLN